MRRLPLFCLVIAFFLLALALPHDASAQRRRAPAHPRRGAVVFVGGYFYDPFFGPYPWWAPAAYPYRYYPVFDERAEVRVMVTPREAAVYVDGYYAGAVDDFDGFFQRLPLTSGPHEITLYLQGYRTVQQRLYLGPRSTYSLRYTMERVGPGETSAPPLVAPPVPAPPPGTATLPRSPRTPVPAYAAAPPPSGFGTVAVRVQPGDADVVIDGEHWDTSETGAPLVVELSEGTHLIEIQRDGFVEFSRQVVVRSGETTPVNVSLTPVRRD